MSEEKVTSIEAAAVLAIFANERYQISKRVPGEGGSWFESVEAVRHVLRNSEEIKSALDGGGKGAELPTFHGTPVPAPIQCHPLPKNAPPFPFTTNLRSEATVVITKADYDDLLGKLSTAAKRAEEATKQRDDAVKSWTLGCPYCQCYICNKDHPNRADMFTRHADGCSQWPTQLRRDVAVEHARDRAQAYGDRERDHAQEQFAMRLAAEQRLVELGIMHDGQVKRAEEAEAKLKELDAECARLTDADARFWDTRHAEVESKLTKAESRIRELETEIKTRREIGSTMFECQQLQAKLDAARAALK
jgi:hypothetical protein